MSFKSYRSFSFFCDIWQLNNRKKFGDSGILCAKMRRNAELSKQKRKKAESLERFFPAFKTLASSDGKKSCATYSGHNCARSLSKSLPFLFLHRFFFFSRIGRYGLRQAVCKTVAFALWKFESFPMQFFIFWIYFNPEFKCERNSNGWVPVFQTGCCGFDSRRSLQF